MRKFSVWLSIGSVVGVSCGPAAAADLPFNNVRSPTAVATDWTGFYIGSHVGGAASDSAWNSIAGGGSALAGAAFYGHGVSGNAITGVQAGYNAQFGRTVVGIEGDASFGSINGLARCLRGAFACTTRIDELWTLAARFGYAAGDLLLYGKAGAAWADVHRRMASGNFVNVLEASEIRTGWLVGVGAEYAFLPGLSGKIEYNYADFGNRSLTMADQFGGVSDVSIGQTAHLVKVGLNYRLGAASVSAAPLPGVPLPQWSWTGIYLGVHAGGGFGRNDWDSATGALLAASSSGGFPGGGDSSGLFGGGQIGANYQIGRWVAGVEASASAADIGGYAKCATDIGSQGSFTCHNSVSSLGMITGRLGQTWGNLLIYGKAGAAWASGSSDAQRARIANRFTESGTRWGWVTGTGLEYALSSNLSAFVEYDHVDLGTADTSYVDQFGNASNVGFKQKFDLVKAGLNYRLGSGAPTLGAGSDAPLFVKAAALPLGWQVEAGTRYWGSSGRMQKDLNSNVLPSRLNSRLIYGDQTGHSLEAFVRVDHASGLFAKANLGLGHLVDGQLNDEDFPSQVTYSNTISEMRDGRLSFGSADIGYNFINDGGRKLGGFVGYRSFYQTGNGFGCLQIATDFATCGVPFPTNYLGLSETESWRGVALGINVRAPLTERLRLEVDAAYLPYVNRAGFDNHWFRADINPQSEVGHGWGTQFEAILSYAVTDRFSVGVGGRYWYFATDSASTVFPGATVAAPMQFYSERYGGFLQTSYKFGDIDRAGTAERGITKAPPIAVANWTGVYVGASVGSGWGRTTYADPFPTPTTGDRVDLGGALLGGQIGVNYQVGDLVAGVEASANWANIRGTDTCFGAFPNPVFAGFNCGSRIDAIGAFTARGGYAIDRTLLYVKGGAAWDRQQDQFNLVGVGGPVISNTSTNWGWTVGGGLEYALAPSWSMALEYKYFDFGASSVFGAAPPLPLSGIDFAPASNKLQTVSLGVNYKFGAWPFARD
ncbi:outer membrane protein [Rhodopseudomonas parapalustris]